MYLHVPDKIYAILITLFIFLHKGTHTKSLGIHLLDDKNFTDISITLCELILYLLLHVFPYIFKSPPIFNKFRSTMSVFYTNCEMHTFSCITMQYLLNCYCVITWCDTSIFFFRTIFGNRRLYILQKIKIDFMTDPSLTS